MKIICKQCGKEFELTQSEINFYKSKNLSMPKRCKECRDKNKQQNGQSPESTFKSAPAKSTPDKSTYIPDAAEEMQNKTYTSKPIKDTGALSGKKGFFIAAAAVMIIAAVLLFLFSDNSDVPDTSKVSGSGFSDAITDFVSDMTEQLQGSDSNSMDIPDTTSATEDPDAAQTSSETENAYSENETAPSEDTSDSTQPPETEETQAATQTTAQTETQTTTPPEREEETAAEITNNLHFRNSSLLEQHYQKHGIEMGFSSAEEYERAAAAVVTDSRVLHKTEADDGDDVYYIEETNEFVVVSTDGYIRTYFNPNRGINYFYDQ